MQLTCFFYQGVVVSLRLLRGELSALRHEHIHLLKGVPMTQKLGFPDVIMPGDVRYDWYIFAHVFWIISINLFIFLNV